MHHDDSSKKSAISKNAYKKYTKYELKTNRSVFQIKFEKNCCGKFVFLYITTSSGELKSKYKQQTTVKFKPIIR